MVVFGIVSSIDREKGRVKVFFPNKTNDTVDLALLTSAGFPEPTSRVACILRDTGGVCLGRIWDANNPPPQS